MLKKLFFREEEEEEELFERVEPVVEKRREEKVTTQSIYDYEEDEKKIVEKTDKKVVKKPIISKENTDYEMSEIISPISGVSETNKKDEKPKKKTVKKVFKQTDDLIPVISPYFGPKEAEEEIIEEDSVLQDIEKEDLVENTQEMVVDQLRNIAELSQDDQEQLKIIEEKTGKFKLDFNEEKTFIDEIDDSMSLDELMSLYEKKFKD